MQTKQAQWFHFNLGESGDGDPNSIQSVHSQVMGHLKDSFRRAGNDYRSQLKNPMGGLKSASMEKCGNLPGAPNDHELEQAFAMIAEQQIRTRVPLLMPYWIGFQLLKKNDDDTRACGIFAFKAGEEMVYIPVFMIDGELQGHEMMYLVSSDQFVPSDEKHINYLLSRKPMEPGKVEQRDRTEILSRATLGDQGYLSGLKLSSYKKRLPKERVEEALRLLFKGAAAAGLYETPRYKFAMSQLDPAKLFEVSSRSVKRAEIWSKNYPIYGRLMDFVMGDKKLQDFSQQWGKVAAFAKEHDVRAYQMPTLQAYLDAKVGKTAELSFGKVEVRGMDDVPMEQFHFMTTEDVDTLHKKGYYVVDTRDQTKLANLVEAKENESITNPDRPGVYKVFMADGTFKKCVVLRNDDPGEWESWRGEKPQFFIIPSGASKYIEAASAKEVIVLSDYFDPDWKAALPGSSSKMTRREYYDSPASCEVGRKAERCADTFLVTPSGYAWKDEFKEETKDIFMRGNNQVLALPNNQSGFTCVSPNVKNSDKSPIVCNQGTFLRKYVESEDIKLGSDTLWFSRINAATKSVRVYKRDHRSGRYSVDGLPEMAKGAALQSLMRRHDLSQKTAEYILEFADEQFPEEVKCRCEKTAFAGRVPIDPLYAMFPPKDQSSDPLTGIPMDSPMNSEEAALGTNVERLLHPLDQWSGAADINDVEGGGGIPRPNAGDVQLASQAAQLGQKEFVSAQMLMSLLREVDDDRVISRYLVIFEKACDALGRLYMQILWRVDAFKERFGDAQYQEFKEMLVALFQSTGDFIAYLRQRDIRPAPVLSIGTVDDNPIFME